jgi:glycosyltransferase involved in cell wall biosynthesis
MWAVLREVMTKDPFDVMHIDQFAMGHYAALARDFGTSVILDVHDIMSDLVARMIETSNRRSLRRLALRAELPRLQRFEHDVCASADVVITVTDRDRDLLSQTTTANARFVTVPIGIDSSAVRRLQRPRTSRTLLTVGTLFYPPNADGIEWFITRVYPLVKRSVPGVRFVAAGRRPPRRLMSLAANDSTIGLPGYVEDVAELAVQAAAVVVPIRVGGGMRVKILEAFAMGVPVVSTSIGCEGIAATHGRHLLVADSAEEFAQHVVTLLENPGLGKEIATAARTLVEGTYDSSRLDSQLAAVYGPPGGSTVPARSQA